ncbi:HelD family protein [Nocardioides albus]|uniref:DNA helicase IV n=1 Tax=Nocardioides albus TaxID=1841 RepID=A0A7W5F8Y5_9ACTN|nr:AAA family ATPase [Nocardioides albus]MBB3089650.1 DNA helicase IV [Nocardioides albus]GGU30368.1 DNA helicase [Nocardioides albus]
MPIDTYVHDELDAERAHLAASRQDLARMRQKVESLDSSDAGNWVSAEILDATLAQRLEQLADDPDVPLFFGRIDRAAGEPGAEPRIEHFHIGRRHVSDSAGDPMVVDWRAPVSVPFYRASRTEPMGLARRRRYGFSHGELTAFEDESLTDTGAGAAEEHSAILEAEIERPRVGPMRDIVATIQPEQDVLVRADLSQTIVVQGAPGTGKTAVGLHRAAYLLYAHRDQLTRRGVLIVGPNASFLRYIRDVLPALGEIEAKQATIAELVASHGALRADEPAPAATLKGDVRMAEVLRRAVWSHVGEPTETLVVPRGSRRWRVPAYEAREALEGLRGNDLRYAAGRALLPRTLAHRVLVQMERSGDSPDDRVHDAVARAKPVKDYAAALWPDLKPAKVLVRLLSDAAWLAEVADGVLTEAEQALLLWEKPPRSAGAARWSLADLVLLDEIADLLDRTPSVAHIVADEAQDLSAMMLRALGRRSTTGSLTILGDLAQATTPWASSSWADALAHLGKPDGHVEQLTRGFRVPADVIAYAARLLPHIAPDLEPPVAVRRARGDLTFTASSVVEALADVLERPGSVGLIVPDAALAAVRAELTAAGLAYAEIGMEADEETEFDAHLDLVPASLAKGLEFDHVVVSDPTAIVAGESDRSTGLRRLYVCLTRAVTSLVVRAELTEGGLPEELGGVPERVDAKVSA